MSKKILSVLFVCAMMFVMVSVASAQQTVYLKGSGNSFKLDGWQNVFDMGDYLDADFSGTEADRVWHLVYTGNVFDDVTEMQITFTNGEVFEWDPSMGPSVNGGGNNPGWVIAAPADWIIVSGLLKTNEGGNINFNISGYNPGKKIEVLFGWLMANATVIQSHKKEIHDPVYASKNGTVVSWANASKNKDYGSGVVAKVDTRSPNGFTYLDITPSLLIANPNGVDVVIATSDPANTPLGMGGLTYTYNVRIVNNNQFVVTVKNFMSGSWGVVAGNSIGQLASPINSDKNFKHQNTNEVKLAVPNQGGCVLFFHGEVLNFEDIIGCKNPREVACNCGETYPCVVTFNIEDCDQCDLGDCYSCDANVACKFKLNEKCYVDLKINGTMWDSKEDTASGPTQQSAKCCDFGNVSVNLGCREVVCLFCNEHKCCK